jgi:ATP-dependent DNA helicase RecG
MSAFAGSLPRLRVQTMRPSVLDPLFASVTTLDGIGSKLAALLANVVPVDTTGRDVRIGDLIFVLPHGMIDRRKRYEIASAPEGVIVTIEVRIDRHQAPPRGNGDLCPTASSHMTRRDELALTFFHAKGAWLAKRAAGRRAHAGFGADGVVQRPPLHGSPGPHGARGSRAGELPLVEPVYPLTAGLSGEGACAASILGAVDQVPARSARVDGPRTDAPAQLSRA